MSIVRRVVSLAPAAVLAACFVGASLTPSVAFAGDSHVESIAAKGHIQPIVPVECGLAFGLSAALVAFGIDRRSRR
jgi:hypothetical protein